MLGAPYRACWGAPYRACCVLSPSSCLCSPKSPVLINRFPLYRESFVKDKARKEVSCDTPCSNSLSSLKYISPQFLYFVGIKRWPFADRILILSTEKSTYSSSNEPLQAPSGSRLWIRMVGELLRKTMLAISSEVWFSRLGVRLLSLFLFASKFLTWFQHTVWRSSTLCMSFTNLQLPGDGVPPVHGAQLMEGLRRAEASHVFLINSPSDSDTTVTGKRINWLWGQTDLGYNPSPRTS